MLDANYPRMTELRDHLLRFVEEDQPHYRRLFLQEKPIDGSAIHGDMEAELRSAGLISSDHGVVHPRVRLNAIAGGILICTDLCSYREVDQVFPIHAEQLQMIDHLQVREGQEVLELGVGSGVLSVYAARSRLARHVWAAEINERAMRFARFNARLNGVENKITVVNSDWFSALSGLTFDVVFSNPPFEPTPPDQEHFYHSSAGTDGLDVVRRILGDYRPFLKADGVLQIVTYSPSNREHLLLTDLLEKAKADLQVVSHPNPIDFDHFMSKYRSCTEDQREFDALTLVVASVAPGNSGPAVRLTPKQVVDYPDILNPIGLSGRGVTTLAPS